MKITAIIVDDEFHCRENLNQIIQEFINDVEVIGMAKDADEARSLMANKQPDLLFLDIQMPPESGFDLLNSLTQRNFSVLFTTALNDYAIEALKAEAVDFLETPLIIDVLHQAVDRVKKRG